MMMATRRQIIGAGAAAVYEGVKGHKTSALILGAGAIYAGKKYEDARKAQNKDKHHYAYSHTHHRISEERHSSEWHRGHHGWDHHDQGLHRGWEKHRDKHGDHD